MDKVNIKHDTVLILENGNEITGEEFNKMITDDTLTYSTDVNDRIPFEIPWWETTPEGRIWYSLLRIKPVPLPRILGALSELTNRPAYGMPVAEVAVLKKYGFIQDLQLSRFQKEALTKLNPKNT
jgi:hypothetical protein